MFKAIIINLIVISTIIFSYAFSLSTEKFENFTLIDYKGKEHSLSDYKNSKAIVLIFVATECPVSNVYNERMEKIYRDYKDKGVQLLGINSNKSESVSDIRNHAIKNNLTFTILKDDKNIIADKFKASFTPEVFVLDPDFNLLYHGRIDDSRREEDVKVLDLRNTLDEILSGKQISNPNTKAFGCTIKRV